MKPIKIVVNTTLAIIALVFLSSCSASRIPEGVRAVQPFDATRYTGKWYEIARLDHSFERGMSHVTAEYSDNGDGTFKVVNRGFSERKNKWSQAVGRAKFIGAPDVGHLKVSFFGPFYGGYIVFDIDPENYQYALVSGPNHSYFWLLSRTPTISDDLKIRLIQKAKLAGFDTSKLIMVQQ
jgi:apolipoprotein D and lipocalin family protein